MLQLVDQAMEQFLRSEVPLPEGAIDISFDAPDRTWGAAVNRPTVNLFLWDVKRNARFAQAGVSERTLENGRIERRPSAAVVDLRYFITAWATQGRDEHQLLGSVLQCLIGHPILPAAHLPDTMGSGTISLTLAASDERKPGDFWSALDGRAAGRGSGHQGPPGRGPSAANPSGRRGRDGRPQRKRRHPRTIRA
jgi:hypothetical protein